LSEIGIVWDSNGDSFHFGLKNNYNVSFGEIIRVASSNKSFYARVTNIESGYTLKQEELLKEMTGSEGFGPFSKYRSIEAQLMLETNETGLRLPSSNPSCGEKVFIACEDDLKILGVEGDLTIGYLRSGGQLTVPVGIKMNALPKHIGLFGMTGSGKTNTELMINACVLDAPGTVGVIFDFHGELWEGKGLGKGLRDHPFFPTKGCFHTGSDVRIGRRTLRTSDVFEMFPDLTGSQRRACRELEREMGESWVRQVIEQDFPQKLKSHKPVH